MKTSHSRQLLFWFLLLVVTAIQAAAQIAGGMTETTNTNLGGNNYISGTVFWPSGKPVNIRMSIKLTSMMRGDILSSTDDSGRFIFSRVSAGTYSVVIDREQDFEAVAQLVEVTQSRNPIPQTYTVSIRLMDKVRLNPKPAVVDKASLGIPKVASDLFNKAAVLSSAGDHKAAIGQLERAIAEYPNYFDACNELGVQYMKINELEKADTALKAALKINPDSYEPLVNRGITLFRLKKYADAETILKSAIAIKSQSAVSHYYLGRTMISLEKYDIAESELNIAIKIGGDEMKEGHRMLANLFIQTGDDKRAIDEIETYLKLAPNAPDAENLRNVIVQLKTPRWPTPAPKPF